jgi:hypothetical protein
VFLKTLHLVSIAFLLTCGGCGQSSATHADAEDSAPAVAEVNRQNGPSSLTGTDENDPGRARPIVIAYYFHRTIRCIPCITVEAVAAETIEKAFHEQLADGRLIWMRINLDDNGGQGYEKQFDISGSALVVAKVNERIGMQYKKLTKVWELLSDPDALSEYVEDEIDEYLNR